jgi:hypothetical protein
MALVKINGRTKFVNSNHFAMRKISNGRWLVEYDRGTFTVIGGKASGGASHEWFCHNPEFYGEEWVPTNSMVRAIELGVAY